MIFDSLGGDLRHALRALPRRPTFTFAAVLTLALGIGATTAIFSVVYSVLIKPLPYPNSDELVRIRHSVRGLNMPMTSVLDRRCTSRTATRTGRSPSIGLWQDGGADADATAANRSACARCASRMALLQALGVQPMRGRWFTEQEHGPAAEGPGPVILSYAFAQRRFGGDEAALGRELSINSRPAQVVGVMPRDFRFLDMHAAARHDRRRAARPGPASHRRLRSLHALARLKPGVTPAEARADLERMLPIWLDAWPLMPGSQLTREAIASWRITPVVRPLKDDIVGDVASALWVLMGAIGAVLLVACANIANLMLVRADARRQEFAVRAALGAVPARIARELLVESLVIGAVGGVLGLVLAYGGLELSSPSARATCRGLRRSRVYPPVLAFTRSRFARVDARVRLDHGAQARAAASMRRFGGARGSSASRERSATRNALGRRAGGARARAGRERGAHDPNVSGVARRRSGVLGPGDDSNGAHLDAEQLMLATPSAYMRMQHEILDAIAALPGVAVRRLYERCCRWKARRSISSPVVRRRPDRCRPATRRRRAESSSSRRATSKPWARGSSRDAT